jgi:DNA-binding MltR family transcriptional regulator
MSDEGARKRWEERSNSPFEPLLSRSGQGPDIDAALRVAYALEYIAAKLGQIDSKLGPILREKL